MGITAVSKISGRSVIRHRTGGVAILLLLSVIVAAAAGATWWYLAGETGEEEVSVLTHEVSLDEFLLEITERGDIESSDDVEVRCEVKAKNTQGTAILKVIKEGTEVKQGDFLVQLDASQLEADRTTQQIIVNTSEALLIEARNLHETAIIAFEEYLEGTFVQEKKTAEGEIFVAEENFSRAQEYLKYSEKLAAKGHITEQQLEADRFAVEKAAKEMEVAKTKLDVLERFTKQKMIKQLESDIATTKAKWEAEKNSFDLEQSRLAEIVDQIEKCTIVAPADGTVVYAHERDYRGNEDFVIEEGAIVRERQTIIRLPNAEQMQVNLNINESLIKYVRPGLRAAILPIGFEESFPGEVISVNRYAEPQNWRRPDVREYRTVVRVDSSSPRIRSGMTAAVTVECAFLPDVIKVPVQCIYAHGSKFYCFVRRGNGFEAQEVQRGPTNDKFFVVESGLEAGEQIALAPRQILDQVELPRLAADQQQQVVRNLSLPKEGRTILQPADAKKKTQSADAASDDADSKSAEAGEQPAAKRGGPLAGKGPVALDQLPSEFRDRAKAYDANGDGKLDATEQAAARKAMAAARGKAPTAGAGQ